MRYSAQAQHGQPGKGCSLAPNLHDDGPTAILPAQVKLSGKEAKGMCCPLLAHTAQTPRAHVHAMLQVNLTLTAF